MREDGLSRYGRTVVFVLPAMAEIGGGVVTETSSHWRPMTGEITVIHYSCPGPVDCSMAVWDGSVRTESVKVLVATDMTDGKLAAVVTIKVDGEQGDDE